jgi:hypothetical protein
MEAETASQGLLTTAGLPEMERTGVLLRAGGNPAHSLHLDPALERGDSAFSWPLASRL